MFKTSCRDNSKIIQIGNKIKLSSFSCNITMSVLDSLRNLQDNYKKLYVCSKVVEHKVNILKLIAFLFFSIQKLKFKIKKLMPFINYI